MPVWQTAQRNRVHLVRGLGATFRCHVLYKMRMRTGKCDTYGYNNKNNNNINNKDWI